MRTVICIKECIMKKSGQKTTTIGKVYEVLKDVHI